MVLEDGGSLIGTSRKVASLGRIIGTQACERRIESDGIRHLRRTRKHSGGRGLKQEHLGGFEVGNGGSALWRIEDLIDGGRGGYILYWQRCNSGLWRQDGNGKGGEGQITFIPSADNIKSTLVSALPINVY
jgi:hypothetical protein